MQVQGKDRAEVEAAGRALGLEGTYIPHSYIELVQIGHLTEVSGGGRLTGLGLHSGWCTLGTSWVGGLHVGRCGCCRSCCA